jgi:hypothetical protein
VSDASGETNSLEADIAAAIKKAKDKTNAQLRDEQAKIVPLSVTQLNAILPSKSDKVKLQALLTIVNSAAGDNMKIAALRSNIEDLSGVILKVLTKVLAATM